MATNKAEVSGIERQHLHLHKFALDNTGPTGDKKKEEPVRICVHQKNKVYKKSQTALEIVSCDILSLKLQ